MKLINYDGLYNKDFYNEKIGKNHFTDKNLHFRIIENGTILPHKSLRVNGQWTWGFGGIVDAKGEFIKSSFVNSGAGAAYTPTEEIIYNPATVVYLGMFFSVWGHCLTDNIKRLWFLKSEVFKEYFKSCPIVCIAWGGEVNLIYNFIKLLEILEVDIKRLQFITKPVKFQTIILPDESFFTEQGELFFT